MSCLLKVSTVRWEQLPKSESYDLKREISFDRLKVWSVIRSPGQMASVTSCKERDTPCIDSKVITRGGSVIISRCGITNATVCEAFAVFFFFAVDRLLASDQKMARREHSEQLQWRISTGDHLLLIWRCYEPGDILQVVGMEANVL